MAGNDESCLYARVGVVEGDIITIKLALDNMTQDLKRLSIKIDEQSLVDGTYRSGHHH